MSFLEKRIIEVGTQAIAWYPCLCRSTAFPQGDRESSRNAVRYADGKVLLELMKEEDQIRVAVHDDGPGIPKLCAIKSVAVLPAGSGSRSRDGGFGLGLAIVHRIARTAPRAAPH